VVVGQQVPKVHKEYKVLRVTRAHPGLVPVDQLGPWAGKGNVVSQEEMGPKEMLVPLVHKGLQAKMA